MRVPLALLLLAACAAPPAGHDLSPLFHEPLHDFLMGTPSLRLADDVLEGAEQLSPPTDAELRRLKKKPASYRMSCQAFVNGDVKIEIPSS